MKNKYDFYEVVSISSTKKSLNKVNGCLGIIMAMEQDNEQKWLYGVGVYYDKFGDEDNFEGWSIEEQYLEPTGKFMKREDFYDGSTAKVVVDKKGQGHLKKLNLMDSEPEKND